MPEVPRSLIAALLGGLAACTPRPATTTIPTASGPQPASIGETFTLDSKILGQQRVINVYVPPGYATTPDARYPVLYMPDGGLAEDFEHVVGDVDISIKNAVIRPVIVVGVENIERRHDVTGPTATPSEQAAAPHAGGSSTFRRFLGDELKPYIAAHYRTTAESALIGESLAGLFVIETALLEPTLFDSYIAADPSLQWNEQALARSAVEHLVAWPASPRQLYIATSDEPAILAGVAILTTALRIIAPPGLTWTYEPMPDEHHSTIFAIAALRGVRTVFALPATAP
jgi:predicted alpha/beta superfamily hydrolase